MALKKSLLTAFCLVTVLAACQKRTEEPVSAAAPPPPADAPPVPAANSTSPASGGDAIDPAAAERASAVAFALAEQKIADDAQGQWATTATASSTYNGAKDQDSYSAWQTTGAPNVERYSDDGRSWASKDADKGIEWLDVQFAKPVHATAIRIRQNNAPGAVIKVELVDDKGGRHSVFSGLDETKYEPNRISWFSPAFEKTDYVVAAARITLATNAVPGWNEIDAVQLVGE